MGASREFWCFISYRHADNRDPGRQWATWLHQQMETYEIPEDLVGEPNEAGDPIPEQIFPVFRDEEELPVDADLSSPIYRALDHSKYLIVLCSPQAVESSYVADEVRYFKQIGKADRILAVMIEGEPNASLDPAKHAAGLRECFPSPLQHPVDADGNLIEDQLTEPIAADFRLPDRSMGWTSSEAYRQALRDAGELDSKAIEHEVRRYAEQSHLALLKILAGTLGVPLGSLTQRDKAYQLAKAQRRARIFRRVAAAMGVLLVAAVLAGVLALQQRGRALEQQAIAEANEREAIEQRDEAERQRKRVQQQLAQIYLDRARERLASYEPTEGLPWMVRAMETDPRLADDPALWAQIHLLIGETRIPNRLVTTGSREGFSLLSQNQRYLLMVGGNWSYLVYDLVEDTLLIEDRMFPEKPLRAVFGQNDQQLVLMGEKQFQAWNLRTGEPWTENPVELKTIHEAGERDNFWGVDLVDAVFPESGDGLYLATAGHADGEDTIVSQIQLWSPDPGKHPRVWPTDVAAPDATTGYIDLYNGPGPYVWFSHAPRDAGIFLGRIPIAGGEGGPFSLESKGRFFNPGDFRLETGADGFGLLLSSYSATGSPNPGDTLLAAVLNPGGEAVTSLSFQELSVALEPVKAAAAATVWKAWVDDDTLKLWLNFYYDAQASSELGFTENPPVNALVFVDFSRSEPQLSVVQTFAKGEDVVIEFSKGESGTIVYDRGRRLLRQSMGRETSDMETWKITNIQEFHNFYPHDIRAVPGDSRILIKDYQDAVLLEHGIPFGVFRGPPGTDEGALPDLGGAAKRVGLFNEETLAVFDYSSSDAMNSGTRINSGPEVFLALNAPDNESLQVISRDPYPQGSRELRRIWYRHGGGAQDRIPIEFPPTVELDSDSEFKFLNEKTLLIEGRYGDTLALALPTPRRPAASGSGSDSFRALDLVHEKQNLGLVLVDEVLPTWNSPTSGSWTLEAVALDRFQEPLWTAEFSRAGDFLAAETSPHFLLIKQTDSLNPGPVGIQLVDWRTGEAADPVDLEFEGELNFASNFTLVSETLLILRIGDNASTFFFDPETGRQVLEPVDSGGTFDLVRTRSADEVTICINDEDRARYEVHRLQKTSNGVWVSERFRVERPWKRLIFHPDPESSHALIESQEETFRNPGGVRLVDLATCEPLSGFFRYDYTIENNLSNITKVDWLPDLHILVVLTDQRVFAYDDRSGELLGNLQNHGRELGYGRDGFSDENAITCTATTPDLGVLFTGDKNGQVRRTILNTHPLSIEALRRTSAILSGKQIDAGGQLVPVSWSAE